MFCSEVGHKYTDVRPEAFPQPLLWLTLGNTVLPRVAFFVSFTATSVTRCYPVAIETRFYSVTLTNPRKVRLPGSELPRSHSVMTSLCKQWFLFNSTFVLIYFFMYNSKKLTHYKMCNIWALMSVWKASTADVMESKQNIKTQVTSNASNKTPRFDAVIF